MLLIFSFKVFSNVLGINSIDEYIKYHDLHNEAEVNFVEIATSDMLRFYLDKYVISLAAERKMIELGLF